MAKWTDVDDSPFAGWLELVYQLHDVGKLSDEWQLAIWKWQMTKSRPVLEPRPALAHSDYDPATDGAVKGYPRPPHAAEGAYASLKLLEEAFGSADAPEFTAALTAIVRHHGALTSLTHFRLIPQAAACVAETLGKRADELKLCASPSPRVQRNFAGISAAYHGPRTVDSFAYVLLLCPSIADRRSEQLFGETDLKKLIPKKSGTYADALCAIGYASLLAELCGASVRIEDVEFAYQISSEDGLPPEAWKAPSPGYRYIWRKSKEARPPGLKRHRL